MRVLAIALVVACGRGAGAGADGPPRFRTVHIDTLAPAKAAQFEAARRAWVAELRAHGATDQRGSFYEVVGVGFLTMRPLARYAELDGRAAARKAALVGVPAEALARYDKLSDDSLVFPHASEIWEVDPDFAFGALDETTAGAIEMVVEDVAPDPASETAYLAAWTEAKRALAAAHSPPSRVTFRSVYGSGRLVTMWLARTRAELAAAPRPHPDAGVLRREVHDVIPRPDLSSP